MMAFIFPKRSKAATKDLRLMESRALSALSFRIKAVKASNADHLTKQNFFAKNKEVTDKEFIRNISNTQP
jgi:hypothetical protein